MKFDFGSKLFTQNWGKKEMLIKVAYSNRIRSSASWNCYMSGRKL